MRHSESDGYFGLLRTHLQGLLNHELQLLNPRMTLMLRRQAFDQLRQRLQINRFSQRFTFELCGQHGGGRGDAK